MPTHNLGKIIIIIFYFSFSPSPFINNPNHFLFGILAVVVAPILSPETENILQSLAMTGQVILLMENYLNFRLEADVGT